MTLNNLAHLIPRQDPGTSSAVSTSRSSASPTSGSTRVTAAASMSGSASVTGDSAGKSGTAGAASATVLATAASGTTDDASAVTSSAAAGGNNVSTNHKGHGTSNGTVRRSDLAPYYTWAAIAGAIVLLFLLRIRRLVVAWYALRRARSERKRKARGSGSSRSDSGSSPQLPKEKGAPLPSALVAALANRNLSFQSYAAASAIWDNIAYLRVFPLWIYSTSNTAELLWTAAYIGIALGIAFWSSWNNGTFKFRNPIAHMAMYQIPLIVGLAAKNNVLSWITGISYQKLNYLHRAAGRTCCLCAWIHTFQWIHDGLGKKGQPYTLLFQSGVVGFVGLNFMLLSSFAIVRRVMYEAFLVIHIVFALAFILAVYYHAPEYAVYCWASLIPWALDRVMGLVKMFIVNRAWLLPFKAKKGEVSNCVIELVDHDVVRITATRPLLRWTGGQHAYITIPTVASLRYEQHPFTIANIPTPSGEVVFLIRAHHGFTKKLRDKMTSNVVSDLPIYIDGPCGTVTSVSHHGTVVMIAGGTGITFALSMFLGVVAAAKKGKAATNRLRLIWNVRHTAHISWIASILNEHLANEDLPADFDVLVDVHVTRSVLADEGGDERGLTEAIVHPPGDHTHLVDSLAHPVRHFADPNSVKRDDIFPASPSSPQSSSASFEGLSTPGLDVYSLDGVPNEKNVQGLNQELLNEERYIRNEKAMKVDGIKYGLAEQTTRFVAFHSGRSNLKLEIEKNVRATSTTMSVGVCGPSQLQLDVRNAIRDVNHAVAVFQGQASIELHIERFGW